MKNVSDKIFRENQNTHFMFDKVFFKSCCLCDVEKCVTASQASDDNMAHAQAYWKTKATDTCSLYVIHIAFPLQQWLHECALALHYTYTACQVSDFHSFRFKSIIILKQI